MPNVPSVRADDSHPCQTRVHSPIPPVPDLARGPGCVLSSLDKSGLFQGQRYLRPEGRVRTPLCSSLDVWSLGRGRITQWRSLVTGLTLSKTGWSLGPRQVSKNGEIPQISLTSLQASITRRTGGKSKRQSVNNAEDIRNSRTTWTSLGSDGVVTTTHQKDSGHQAGRPVKGSGRTEYNSGGPLDY